MKKIAAEAYRDIDFAGARRGAVTGAQAGKTKISIRIDNRVLDHFRFLVEQAGAGNYQTLINDALVSYIQRRSMLASVRQVMREEFAGFKGVGGRTGRPVRARPRGNTAAG